MGDVKWLKIGGLSFGALASGLPPNLAQLLAAQEQGRAQWYESFELQVCKIERAYDFERG